MLALFRYILTFSSTIEFLNLAARKSVRFDKKQRNVQEKINQGKSIHKEIMVKILYSNILSSTLISLTPIDPILSMLLTRTTSQ